MFRRAFFVPGELLLNLEPETGGAYMAEPRENVVETLLRENDEFRRLHREHSDYEKRLEDLCGHHFLSDQEKIELVELKKKKLLLKDRMLEISEASLPH
jgi:uncharacterized protein YdcH (DUF465 family)